MKIPLRSWLLGIACLLLSNWVTAQDAQPNAPQIEILKPGVRLTLMAEHPQLVTPTGIDVDERGRIWLVACHTHFRPESYTGPEGDEILVFDSDGSNRHVFYQGTIMTMQLALGPDGWIYLAQRDRILRVRDSDGDGVGDVEQEVARLETVTDYPHNGLSGMAWHPDGGLVFALGENFGKDWTLTSADGSSLKGRGEGGIFHCTADGKGLRRIARGFWNPFGLLVRNDGMIFAADNDPGSRPPCRLLQVVEGADYGFQYVYGSAPIHPFVAWNGELRGTLGMAHPCGEGPSAVIELGGGVMIPSWSNHCIDYYPLRWNGASLTSERIELLRGSDFFRPVCMATGPDGAVYITDWVSSSYEVHGLGRLWKLEFDHSLADWLQAERDPMNATAELADRLRNGTADGTERQWFELARSEDKFLSDAALTALGRASQDWTPESLLAMSPQDQLWALVALRRVALEDPRWVRALWKNPDPEIRFECLRWIADAVMTEFQEDVETMLTQSDMEYRNFEAVIATLNTLKGNPSAGVTDPEQMIARVLDPNTPPATKAFALRLIPVHHPSLTVPVLLELMQLNDRCLSLEVVRTLWFQETPEAMKALLAISASPQLDSMVAHEVNAALATFSIEAESSVEDSLRWLDGLPGDADPDAGRRIFFHSKKVNCSQCHRYEGRGNVVGPDLSLIARQGDRRQILQSILEPNREVAPQFYATYLELADDSSFTGILLRSSSTEVYRDSKGDEVTFQKSDIIQRRELRSSLMPTGLASQLTGVELRDLLAFLTQATP